MTVTMKPEEIQPLLMIPTYNERENLEPLVREIFFVSPQLHLLIIDDSSPDGTGAIADRLAKEFPQIHVRHRPPRSGRGTCSMDGYAYAMKKGYTHYLEIDCDHSHSPRELLPLLTLAAAGADLTIGSRFLPGGGVEGWTWRRHALHFFADCAVRLLLGTPNTDHTNGLRCYNVAMLKKIDLAKLNVSGYVAHTLLENVIHRAGFTIREFPSFFRERRSGFSKMKMREAVYGIRAMIQFRRKRSCHGIGYFLLQK